MWRRRMVERRIWNTVMKALRCATRRTRAATIEHVRLLMAVEYVPFFGGSQNSAGFFHHSENIGATIRLMASVLT